MTLDKARELLKVQAGFGGFYNGNSAKLILSEVIREHGQAAVDQLIRETELDKVFGFEADTVFNGGLAVKDKYSKDKYSQALSSKRVVARQRTFIIRISGNGTKLKDSDIYNAGMWYVGWALPTKRGDHRHTLVGDAHPTAHCCHG